MHMGSISEIHNRKNSYFFMNIMLANFKIIIQNSRDSTDHQTAYFAIKCVSVNYAINYATVNLVFSLCIFIHLDRLSIIKNATK